MGYGTLPNTGGPSLIYMVVAIIMLIIGAVGMAAHKIKSLFTSSSGPK